VIVRINSGNKNLSCAVLKTTIVLQRAIGTINVTEATNLIAAYREIEKETQTKTTGEMAGIFVRIEEMIEGKTGAMRDAMTDVMIQVENQVDRGKETVVDQEIQVVGTDPQRDAISTVVATRIISLKDRITMIDMGVTLDRTNITNIANIVIRKGSTILALKLLAKMRTIKFQL
jgi:hypothetical protein